MTEVVSRLPARTALACDQCHVGNNFTGAATQCVACRQNDYNQTSQPNHAQAAFHGLRELPHDRVVDRTV
jgi:hypothetical protein